MLPSGVVPGASRRRGTRLCSGARGDCDRSRSVGRAQPAGKACSTTDGGWIIDSAAGVIAPGQVEGAASSAA